METPTVVAENITERPLAPRDAWSYFELISIGSSESSPEGGDPYTFDHVIEENFPEWVFSSPAQKDHSLDEINNAREGEALLSEMFGPLDIRALPANCTFKVFLGSLKPGLPKIEYAIAKWLDDQGTSAKEIEKPAVIRQIGIEEKYKPSFKLEPVPNHPERRYLVPIRRAA